MTQFDGNSLRTLVGTTQSDEEFLIRIEQESMTRPSDPDVIVITKTDLESILKKLVLQ